MVFGALVLVLVQAGLGMVVNLYVSIPGHHPGTRGGGYFDRSFHSVVWAIGHGATALAIHATLGLLLILMSISVARRAFAVGRRAVGTWTTVAGLLILGAAFNGASFLDFNYDVSSLIMALLAFAAAASYAVALYLLA
ncbi:MAG TPA: hypothetical protein VKV06_14110 [Acidimicrobiales bacterium]|nr:hypothetical protein [Acidimicrobiales bacterium]